MFELISGQKHSFGEVKDSVSHAFRDLFGVQGLSAARPRLLGDRFDFDRQRGVIVVNRLYVHKLVASLCFAKHIGKSKIIYATLGISGIIKKALAKYY